MTAERAEHGWRRRLGRGRHLEEEWRGPWEDGPAAGDVLVLDDDHFHPEALMITRQHPVVTVTSLPPRLPAPPPASDIVTPVVTAREGTLRFRRSAAALALASGTGETDRTGARECGAALAALAAGGHESNLAEILRADPADIDTTWTVACYQIGDLSPSALRDFAEVAPAVLTLSACETAAHVAAELIVTNGEGVRWTALVRSGTDVRYQPLGPATAGAADAAALATVRRHWEDRLLLWTSDPTAGLGETPGRAEVETPELEERVAALEPVVDELEFLKIELVRIRQESQELAERVRRAEEGTVEAQEQVSWLEAELRRSMGEP